MRHYGTIAHWNEARKFGAILEEYSQKEVFAPLAAFDRTDPPPTVGERVSFEMTVGRRNRDEAADIRYMDRFADEEEDGFQTEASDSIKKTALTAFIRRPNRLRRLLRLPLCRGKQRQNHPAPAKRSHCKTSGRADSRRPPGMEGCRFRLGTRQSRQNGKPTAGKSQSRRQYRRADNATVQ